MTGSDGGDTTSSGPRDRLAAYSRSGGQLTADGPHPRVEDRGPPHAVAQDLVFPRRHVVKTVPARAPMPVLGRRHFQAGAASDVVFGPVRLCRPVPSILTVTTSQRASPLLMRSWMSTLMKATFVPSGENTGFQSFLSP